MAVVDLGIKNDVEFQSTNIVPVGSMADFAAMAALSGHQWRTVRAIQGAPVHTIYKTMWQGALFEFDAGG